MWTKTKYVIASHSQTTNLISDYYSTHTPIEYLKLHRIFHLPTRSCVVRLNVTSTLTRVVYVRPKFGPTHKLVNKCICGLIHLYP